MLEVLVAPNSVGVAGRRGDVISAGLAGTPWSDAECVMLLGCQWSDDELEARLLARRAAGEPWPIEGLPYRGEPAVDVVMLPGARDIPAFDESGKEIEPTRDPNPMTAADLQARLAAAKAEDAKLPAGRQRMGSIDVSQPPDLSVPRRGGRRWSRVCVNADGLRATWNLPRGSFIRLDELAGPTPDGVPTRVTFDGELVAHTDLQNGAAALEARLAAARLVRGGAAPAVEGGA